MIRIDALQASSRELALKKINKYIDHVMIEEGINLGLVNLTYRGDGVFVYTLLEKEPDKGYLLGGLGRNGSAGKQYRGRGD